MLKYFETEIAIRDVKTLDKATAVYKTARTPDEGGVCFHQVPVWMWINLKFLEVNRPV